MLGSVILICSTLLCLQSTVARTDVVIEPLFTSAYRIQFYSVVAPYLLREYQRKNVQNSGIRVLNENDPDIKKSLEGQIAVITGGSRGLGVEVVRTFLRKGAHVITTASTKDPKRIQERYDNITHMLNKESPWKLEIWHLDLMSMNSVNQFAQRFRDSNYTQLSYFIGNAGVMFPKYKLSTDGFESQFSINYIGHVLLAYNFLPYLYDTALQTGQQSRLILVSSCLHHIPVRIRFSDLQSRQVYSPHYSYGLSKVAIVMFINKLSSTLRTKSDWGHYVKAFSVHPGLVDTDLLSTIDIIKQYPALAHRFTLRSVKAGAETIIYGALSNQLNHRSGAYLEDSAPAVPSYLSQSKEDQDRLWKISQQLLAKWTGGSWFEDLKHL